MAYNTEGGSGSGQRKVHPIKTAVALHAISSPTASKIQSSGADKIKTHDVFHRTTESYTISRDQITGAVTGVSHDSITKNSGFAFGRRSETQHFSNGQLSHTIVHQRGLTKNTITMTGSNGITVSNTRTKIIGSNVKTRTNQLGQVISTKRFNDSAPVKAGRMIATKAKSTVKTVQNGAVMAAAKARSVGRELRKAPLKTLAKGGAAIGRDIGRSGIKLTKKAVKIAPKSVRLIGTGVGLYAISGVKKLAKPQKDEGVAEATKGTEKITTGVKAAGAAVVKKTGIAHPIKSRYAHLSKKKLKIKKKETKLIKKNLKSTKKLKKIDSKLKKGGINSKRTMRLRKKANRIGGRINKRSAKIARKNLRLAKITKKLQRAASVMKWLTVGAGSMIVVLIIFFGIALLITSIGNGTQNQDADSDEHERIPFFKEEWYDDDYEPSDDHEYDTFAVYGTLSSMDLSNTQIAAIMGCMMYNTNGDFYAIDGIKANSNYLGETQTICHWTGDRLDNLKKLAGPDEEGEEPAWKDIGVQLDYFQMEYEGDTYEVPSWKWPGKHDFEKTSDITSCVETFASQFMGIAPAAGTESYGDGYSAQVEMARKCWEEITGCPYPSPSISLPGEAYLIWQFLSEKGLPDAQIAGILGNFGGECGGQTIEGINHLVVESNGEGIGLGQWSYSRKTALMQFAKSRGKSWMDLDTQLEYLWREVNGTSEWGDPGDVYSASEGKKMFMEAKTPEDAAYAFMRFWERNAGWNTLTSRNLRENLAKEAYEMMQIKFSWPLPKNRTTVTSWYGNYDSAHVTNAHNGTDLGAPEGTPIYSVADGVIRSVTRYNSARGTYVEIDHGDMATLYQHMQYGSYADYGIKPGMTVKAGQTIGRVGNTGESTGPHLHIELLFKQKGEWRDFWSGNTGVLPYKTDAIKYLADFTQHDPIIDHSE